MVLKNLAMRTREGFSKRIIGLSINVWLLLFLPVSIAFFVGGAAPMVLGNSFNIGTAIFWAIFVFIVDLTIIRTETGIIVGAFRLILLLLSMSVTAVVGDLHIFADDIEEYRSIEIESRYQEAIIKWEQKKTDKRSEMDIEEEDGRGEVWEILKLELKGIQDNRPSKKSIKGGFLVNIELLHKLVMNDSWALFFAFGQAFMVMLLEAMPFALKNATLKRQYR